MKSAAFDAPKKTLHVTASFKNTADGPQEPIYVNGEVTVSWQGQTWTLSSESSGSIAPNTSNDRSLFASPLPDGFVVAEAIVTFGESGQHQAMVPLSGASATSEQPRPLTVGGTLRMELARFKLASGEVIPAKCFATNRGLTFEPGNAKDVAILIRGDAIANASLGLLGSVNITGGDIKLPNGDRIGAVSQDYINLTPGERERDQAMCFTVPAPAKGTYKVRMAMDMKSGSTVSIQVP